jgi:hypothetical protein
MRAVLSLFFVIFICKISFTQGNCGLNYEEGYLLREQMFRNRVEVPLQTIRNIQNNRFTIHIPLVIHLVGNSNGQGFVAAQNVLGMVCRLNNDFADQNLRFYIKDSLRYLRDDLIFADAYDSLAVNRMITYKDTTALNIFTNGSAGGGVAGYYSRRGDYVFMLNSYANASSPTITHEIGHFFTLPHTFFGWENIDARQLHFNTPAPDSIGTDWRRREVEYVDRTGPLANCYSSADGFCDTDADYISERAQCPLSGTALDPSGTPISPNTTLYMSYFYDACVNNFTPEQKTAIMASVVNRNWLFFTAPNTDSLNWNAITHTIPADASTIQIQDSVSFEWNLQGVGPAEKYILFVERLIFGTPVGVIYNSIVPTNSVKLPSNLFINSATYRWQVMPYSNGFTCAGFSNPTTFTVQLPASVENITGLTEFSVNPNPVKGDYVNIFYKLTEETELSFRVLSYDGKVIISEPFSAEPATDNFKTINISNLPSGIYIVQMICKNGIQNRKIEIVKQ